MNDPIETMNYLRHKIDGTGDTTIDEELTVKNQIFNIENETLVKQDQLVKIQNDKLNKQLDSLKDVENNIINKDRIIEQTNLHIENNNKNIYTLYASLFLSLILFISIILYSVGQLSDRLLNIIIVSIILLFLCVFLYTYNIFHFATLVHFLDNRKNLHLGRSVENLKRKIGLDLQEKLYGDKKDFIDKNCDCEDTDTEEVYTDEENIGVDIKPGYFYYDKSAPKQKLMPHGGDDDNVSLNATKPIYDKIDWSNHDKITSDPDSSSDNTKSYRINPNNYDVYKSGTLVADSTFTVNL